MTTGANPYDPSGLRMAIVCLAGTLWGVWTLVWMLSTLICESNQAAVITASTPKNSIAAWAFIVGYDCTFHILMGSSAMFDDKFVRVQRRPNRFREFDRSIQVHEGLWEFGTMDGWGCRVYKKRGLRMFMPCFVLVIFCTSL